MNALAWQVELDKHEGFMGGLQHNYQLKTAPYYANSICEVLFHVSTQMNIPNDQNKISKWRHLGNDSVQIIWSEHTKDYDRSILATEFADVIICIYPLRNGLFRIQIIKKQSVRNFFLFKIEVHGQLKSFNLKRLDILGLYSTEPLLTSNHCQH
jgi:hypothetical protein